MRTEMDQYLASIYDTTDTIEKIAQHADLYKMAEQEGINLSGLTQEELDELAAAQLTAIGGQQDASQQAPMQDTVIKEAQANLELADYMGRIMAHAYYQEMGNIEKSATAISDISSIAHSGGTLAKHHAGKAVGRVGDYIKENPRRAGMIGGAGLGTAGAAAIGSQMGKEANQQQPQQEQQGSQGAFDQLARQRAAQILQEQGFDTQQLEQFVQQQEVAQQQEFAQQQMVEQAQAQHQQQLQAQQQQQLAQQQYQQQAQQQYEQQMRSQQQQEHVQQIQQPRMQQQNAAPQAMAQAGQQNGSQQFGGQAGQRQQPGFRQPQQQVAQQPQQQQSQQNPQAQQAEAIKMANDMMMQQFSHALDEHAWQILAQAGYPIQEEQGQQQQAAQPQMGQQQQMPQQQMMQQQVAQ